MELLSRLARRASGSRGLGKASALSVVLLGLSAVGSVQAANLTCGSGSTPLRISTTKANWSTDARYVSAPSGAAATIVNDYKWSGWFDKTTAVHPAGAGALASQALQGEWLSFGDSTFTVGQTNSGNTTTGSYAAGTKPYPAVITDGVVANGALVAQRVSFTYNDKINIASNVDLSTIKLIGSGGFDDSTQLLVKPDTAPSGATNWLRTSASFNGYGIPSLINVSGANTGMGFYYGGNTISFAVENTGHAPTDSAGNPTGLFADFEITADCLKPVAAQPTEPLMCPAGNKAGDPIKIGPFTTNARDWKWTWRTNAAGTALENVTQPLYDDFIFRDYFKPTTLTGANATDARWISPGSVDPSGADIPGVPYPLAIGQHKAGYYGSVFMLNQPITVGNNVDLASIKLDGRFAFDNTGDSVFVQPAGQQAPSFQANILPDGYGAFTTYTTPAINGFQKGQNTIGLVLDGGEPKNDCTGGACVMAAIADFYVTGTCTGEAPILPPDPAKVVAPVPTLDLAGLGLLGLLSAGMGAFALRRRKRAQ